MLTNIKKFIFDNWTLGIVILMIIMIVLVAIYGLYNPKTNLTNDNEMLNQKIQLNNLSEKINTIQTKPIKVSEYTNEEQNTRLISIINKETIPETITSYSFQKISGNLNKVDSPEVYDHKVLYENEMIYGVYIYRPIYDGENNVTYNYIIATVHPENYVDEVFNHYIKDTIVINSSNTLEIVDLFLHNGKILLFYTETIPMKSGRLTGRKRLMVGELYNDDHSIKIINQKQINIPPHIHLYNLNIIQEDSSFTLIYRVRLSEQREKIDIILSKMDIAYNVFYSTNIPVDIPAGVYNSFSATKIDKELISNDIGNYALAFSYVNLVKEESSSIIVFFDKDGNLNELPYIEIDPDKPSEYQASEVKLIGFNDAFYVFYKYAETGYYMTVISPKGERIFTSTPILDNDKTGTGLSFDIKNDKLVGWNGSIIKEISTNEYMGEIRLLEKQHKFISDRIYLNDSNSGDIFVNEDNLFIFWAMNYNTTYSSVLEYNNLFE
jgi:hypothetical protein